MPEFEVTYEGRVREIYFVEADTAEEARVKYSDLEPYSSEVLDGGVVSVEEAIEDD